MTKLATFGVKDNNMSGPLPPQYSAWKLLKGLWAFDNSFSGTLPPQVRRASDAGCRSTSPSALAGRQPAASRSEWDELPSLAAAVHASHACTLWLSQL